MGCFFDTPGAGVPLVQNREAQTIFFEGSSHPARRCSDCGHVFFDPPAPDLLDRYYNGEYPAAAASWYNVVSDYDDEKVNSRADRVISIASGFGFALTGTNQAPLYHEIGCAFGGTVQELNRRGYLATGTDLNASAVAQGRARGNDAIAPEPDADFLRRAGRRPNVLFGHHVFEHIPDPAGYLRDLASCMAADSIVILFVPNAMALFPAAYGFMHYIWFGFPGHLNLFTAGSAPCLARAAGYDLLGVGSRQCGIEPAATNRALSSELATPVTARIRDRLVEDGLMAEELVLVLTPAGSPAASRHAAELTATARRCADNAAFEAGIRDLSETTVLADPLAIRPSFPELTELLNECRAILKQRDGQLADALERVKEADLLRQAIETSTFWRATKGVRLLAGWLKLHGLQRRPFGNTARPVAEQRRG